MLESYINKNCYSIDYEIMTDKNNVVLSLKRQANILIRDKEPYSDSIF